MKKFNLKVLLLLSLGHCITDIYQSALPAALPFLKAKLGLSYTTAGMILIASNIASSVVQPLFGVLADKKEKPFMLPLGCFCAGLGFALLAYSSSYAIILLLVLLSGLGIAAYHPEGFKTASYFTGEKKATGMSIFSVGGNLGFALGPIFALYILSRHGIEYLPIMIVPAALFVVLIWSLWHMILVPELGMGGHKKEAHEKTPRSAYVSLALVIGAVVMRSWTQFGLVTYIPFYYIDTLKGDPLYAGKLISVFLLSGVIGTLAGGRIADRWGHNRILIFSMGLSFLLFPLIFFVKGLLLFVVFGVLGFVLVSSFAVTMVISQSLLPNNVGMASGLMAGFAIGTGGLGVTLLGVVADAYGVPAALNCIMFLPLVGFIMSLLIRYPHQDARRVV